MNETEKWEAIMNLLSAQQKVIEKAVTLCISIDCEFHKAKEALNRAS